VPREPLYLHLAMSWLKYPIRAAIDRDLPACLFSRVISGRSRLPSRSGRPGDLSPRFTAADASRNRSAAVALGDASIRIQSHSSERARRRVAQRPASSATDLIRRSNHKRAQYYRFS